MKSTEPLSGPEPTASSRQIASRLVVDSVLARLDGLDARLKDGLAELGRTSAPASRLDAAVGRIDALQARTEGLERLGLGRASCFDRSYLQFSQTEATHAVRIATLEAEQARLRASLTSGRELVRLLLVRVREKVLGSPQGRSQPSPLRSMLSRLRATHLAEAAERPGIMVVGSDAASTIESCRAIWPDAVSSEGVKPRILRIAADALPAGAEAIDDSMLVVVDCTMTSGAGWAVSVREAVAFIANRGFASVDACVDASGDTDRPRLSVAFVRSGQQTERTEH